MRLRQNPEWILSSEIRQKTKIYLNKLTFVIIMKSKIKHLGRTEQEARLVFELDNDIIKNIEKTFKKLKSDFKLSSYKKKYGGKILENFWELQKKNEEFNFSLVVKRNIVRFKLKSDLDFINKFLNNLKKYTEFSELSPKAKIKFEKSGLKRWADF